MRKDILKKDKWGKINDIKEEAGSLSITSVRYECIINVTINAESKTHYYPWCKVGATRKKDKWEKR